MKKILIIGAGGIGSYLIPLLQRTGLYEITAYDPDKVEKKNLTYQNFKDGDESEHKVSVMKRRFKIQTTQPFPILTASQLEGYDLVVCCADNLDVRRLLYRDGKQWHKVEIVHIFLLGQIQKCMIHYYLGQKVLFHAKVMNGMVKQKEYIFLI